MFPIITAIKAISNRRNNKISESVFLKNFAAISPINPAKTIFKKKPRNGSAYEFSSDITANQIRPNPKAI